MSALDLSLGKPFLSRIASVLTLHLPSSGKLDAYSISVGAVVLKSSLLMAEEGKTLLLHCVPMKQ